MDAALKELSKLEKLTGVATLSGKGKSPATTTSLDALIQSLRNAHASIQAGIAPYDRLPQMAKEVESRKKEVDERQKEVYGSIAKIGKALDKKFTMSLPTFDPLFASEESAKALERTIAIHLLRTGQFETAETFLQESDAQVDPDSKLQLLELHRILQALRIRDVRPALEWAATNRPFLESRTSSLEFYLHRFEYLRLLLSLPPNTAAAIQYASVNLTPFYTAHPADFKALLACVAYLPLHKLSKSPYASLAEPGLHADLEGEFAREYCARLGMSRQVPLRVISDIGGGGALVRIEKGRRVMRERKSEWSQTDELPIEIPLAPENRYHSIFACPVSKEQTTESNPPMMMNCGHVIAKESLSKLSKPGGRVKCPYCPKESQMSTALRLYF